MRALARPGIARAVTTKPEPENVIYFFDTSGHDETLSMVVQDGFFADPFWELHIQLPEGYAIGYPSGPSAPMCPALVGSAAKPAVGDPIYRVAGGNSKVDGRFWGPTDPNLFENPGRSLGLPGDNTGNIIARDATGPSGNNRKARGPCWGEPRRGDTMATDEPQDAGSARQSICQQPWQTQRVLPGTHEFESLL